MALFKKKEKKYEAQPVQEKEVPKTLDEKLIDAMWTLRGFEDPIYDVHRDTHTPFFSEVQARAKSCGLDMSEEGLAKAVSDFQFQKEEILRGVLDGNRDAALKFLHAFSAPQYFDEMCQMVEKDKRFAGAYIVAHDPIAQSIKGKLEDRIRVHGLSLSPSHEESPEVIMRMKNDNHTYNVSQPTPGGLRIHIQDSGDMHTVLFVRKEDMAKLDGLSPEELDTWLGRQVQNQGRKASPKDQFVTQLYASDEEFEKTLDSAHAIELYKKGLSGILNPEEEQMIKLFKQLSEQDLQVLRNAAQNGYGDMKISDLMYKAKQYESVVTKEEIEEHSQAD